MNHEGDEGSTCVPNLQTKSAIFSGNFFGYLMDVRCHVISLERTYKVNTNSRFDRGVVVHERIYNGSLSNSRLSNQEQLQ